MAAAAPGDASATALLRSLVTGVAAYTREPDLAVLCDLTQRLWTLAGGRAAAREVLMHSDLSSSILALATADAIATIPHVQAFWQASAAICRLPAGAGPAAAASCGAIARFVGTWPGDPVVIAPLLLTACVRALTLRGEAAPDGDSPSHPLLHHVARPVAGLLGVLARHPRGRAQLCSMAGMACVGELLCSGNDAVVEAGIRLWAPLLVADAAAFTAALLAFGAFGFRPGYLPNHLPLQAMLSGFLCALARSGDGCDVLRAPRILETALALLRAAGHPSAAAADDAEHNVIVSRVAVVVWGYSSRLRSRLLGLVPESGDDVSEVAAFSLENLPLHVNAVDALMTVATVRPVVAVPTCGCISAMAMHATFGGTWPAVRMHSV